MIESSWSDNSMRILQDRLSRPLPRKPAPARDPAAERGRVAERLVPVAWELSQLVHGEGDHVAIGEFLATVHPRRKDALLVVAAGMIPQDRKPWELLTYVTWDASGRVMAEGPVIEEPWESRRGTWQEAQPCGSPGGAARHRRHGERACDACRAAEPRRGAKQADTEAAARAFRRARRAAGNLAA